MKLENIQTFSESVKEEICANIKQNENLELVIFSYLKNIAEYNLTSDCFEFKTKYPSVVKLFKQFCIDHPEYLIEISISNQKTLRDKKTNYLVKFLSNNQSNLYEKLSLINFLNLEDDIENLKLILVGCFLSGGSINNLDKTTYHLEFRTLDVEYRDVILNILKKINLSPKTIYHHNKWIVYLKKSTEISDLLKALHANKTMYALEDKRITKDVVNSIQRLVNIEVFNINKISKAAVEQNKICQVIQTSIHYNHLTEKEKLYCDIRATDDKKNMQQICDLMNIKLATNKQKITKGSLSHIVKKMRELYKLI